MHSQRSNPIQIENRKPGTRSWDLINVARDHEIEGYASLTSVDAGGEINFFVNTVDRGYTLTIYRIGYYQGLGGRQMTMPLTQPGISQPIPAPNAETGLIECLWTNPCVFKVPADWVSGIYLVKLTGVPSGKESYIVFVVRNDGRPSDLIFQSTVTTCQAYNAWGGKSLYRSNSTGNLRAVKVSFNRPYDDGCGAGLLLYWELNMIGFLEKEGYDLVYSSNIDTHVGVPVSLHKGFLSVGHDEYFSWEMRQNVEHARDEGMSLGFFGANGCYWQIRLEHSPATGDSNRTVVCHKVGERPENWPDPAGSDPSKYHLLTTRWRDPHVALPGNPEDALIGVMYNGRQPVDADIVIEESSSWVFANTGLERGSVLRGLLGYEADRMYGNAPAGTVRLAHSPYRFGQESTEYSDMTVYQAASAATVFAAGTLQWSFGLSDISPWSPSPSRLSPAAQQITRNILARFIGERG